MKIISKVMVFVMGVVVIGVVATTVGITIQAKNVEKSVTFELLENEVFAFNVYDKITEYAIIDNDGTITNLTSVKHNNEEQFLAFIIYNSSTSTYALELDGDIYINIFSNNHYLTQLFSEGDVLVFTFDVVVETPIFVKTLLLLIPLVLSASVIGYLVIKGGKE